MLYLRVGGNFDRRGSTGWYGGAGVKYPFGVDEDAYFPDLGYSYRFGESEAVGVMQAGTGTPFRFFQPKSSVDSLGLGLRYGF